MNGAENMGEQMKSSPANGPGTPRDDGGGSMGDFGMGNFGNNSGGGGGGGNVS